MLCIGILLLPVLLESRKVGLGISRVTHKMEKPPLGEMLGGLFLFLEKKRI